MDACSLCGNHYDKAFKVVVNDETYTFDSFECAIHMLAPHCSHCDCTIIGHGTEANGQFFCCAHCARQMGFDEIQDRA